MSSCEKKYAKHDRNMKRLKQKGACGRNAKSMIDNARDRELITSGIKDRYHKERKERNKCAHKYDNPCNGQCPRW